MVAISLRAGNAAAAFPVDWMVPQWPAPAWVGAVMSARCGGVSRAPYDQLNLGDHVQDAPFAVAQNRRILEQAIDVPAIFLQQVHGIDVVQLTAETRTGIQHPQADACYTQIPEVACTIQVADCLPVLLCHAHCRIVGAAHAGWRGLVGRHGRGVLEQLLEQMRAQCPGADAAGWMAWLGPCIGPKAFEVGDEVRNAFLSEQQQSQQCFVSSDHSGKWMADLAALARQRLVAQGVSAVFGNDSTQQWCTFSQLERWFSYRRDGRTGRMAAAVWLQAAG